MKKWLSAPIFLIHGNILGVQLLISTVNLQASSTSLPVGFYLDTCRPNISKIHANIVRVQLQFNHG